MVSNMSDILTDSEIQELLYEQKHLPNNYRNKYQLKEKRAHKESELDVTGIHGSEFRIIIRQSKINTLDFSVILGYRMPQSTRIFRLRRYNGKSHFHTNKLEGNGFYDFHIHMATQRYQEGGFREDGYAETTDKYGDVKGAIECLLKDCNFIVPGHEQESLF